MKAADGTKHVFRGNLLQASTAHLVGGPQNKRISSGGDAKREAVSRDHKEAKNSLV